MRLKAVPPRAERKQPEIFLLDLEHAQVALGLVVVERDRQVVEEGEYCILVEPEPFEQIARRGLLDPAALVGTTGRQWIGRQADREEVLVTGHEAVALHLREAGRSLCSCLVGGRFHLAQQPLEVCGPGLLMHLLNGVVTNDKFCWTRFGRLSLSFWRRPLRLRGVAASGEHSTPSETAMRGLGGGTDAPPLADPATGPAA
jgi:hypothetical protein